MGPTGHPLLDVLVVALGLGAGYLVATDTRGPLAGMSPYTRVGGLLVLGFFAIEVFGRVAGLLAPVLNGVITAGNAFEFVAGLVLTGVLALAFLILRGDVSVNLAAVTATRSGAGLVVPKQTMPTDARCTTCARPVRPGARFCNACGTPLQAASQVNGG